MLSRSRFVKTEVTSNKDLHKHYLFWWTPAYAEQLVQDFNAVPNSPHTSQMELAEVIHPATGRLSIRRLLDSSDVRLHDFLAFCIDRHVTAECPMVVAGTANEEHRVRWSRKAFDVARYNYSVDTTWNLPKSPDRSSIPTDSPAGLQRDNAVQYGDVMHLSPPRCSCLRRLRQIQAENNGHL